MHALLRLLLVALGAVFCLLMAGIIFGFASLKLIFVETGVYADYCPNPNSASSEGPCAEQLVRLDLMFTIAASATNVSALLIGWVLDTHGPKVSAMVGSVLFLGGCLLFGFAGPTRDFYFPGLTLLAIGGPFIFMSTIHLSRSFPKRAGLIMSVLTGSFDASSSVFVAFKELHHRLGLSLSILFLSYCVVPVSAFLYALVLMPKRPFDGTESASAIDDDDNTTVDDEESQPLIQKADTSSDSTNDSDQVQRRDPDELGLGLVSKSARGQISSLVYWLMVAVMCMMMLRLNFYMSTVTEQLKSIFGPTDQDVVNGMVWWFSILLPLGGVMAIPFTAWFLDYYTVNVSFSVLTIMSILWGVLSLIRDPVSQYLSIVTFVVKRPFLYTIASEFSVRAFGFRTFGKVYGFLTLLAGLFNLIQASLSSWAVKDGYFWINVGLTVVTVLVNFVFAMYLTRSRVRHVRSLQRSPRITVDYGTAPPPYSGASSSLDSTTPTIATPDRITPDNQPTSSIPPSDNSPTLYPELIYKQDLHADEHLARQKAKPRRHKSAKSSTRPRSVLGKSRSDAFMDQAERNLSG